MESELSPIFENIKNFKEDFAKYKEAKAKTTLSIESSETKVKHNNTKKTEPLSSHKKV